MFWVLIYIFTNFLAPIPCILAGIDDFIFQFAPKSTKFSRSIPNRLKLLCIPEIAGLSQIFRTRKVPNRLKQALRPAKAVAPAKAGPSAAKAGPAAGQRPWPPSISSARSSTVPATTASAAPASPPSAQATPPLPAPRSSLTITKQRSQLAPPRSSSLPRTQRARHLPARRVSPARRRLPPARAHPCSHSLRRPRRHTSRLHAPAPPRPAAPARTSRYLAQLSASTAPSSTSSPTPHPCTNRRLLPRAQHQLPPSQHTTTSRQHTIASHLFPSIAPARHPPFQLRADAADHPCSATRRPPPS
jgi:hypothetical protein